MQRNGARRVSSFAVERRATIGGGRRKTWALYSPKWLASQESNLGPAVISCAHCRCATGRLVLPPRIERGSAHYRCAALPLSYESMVGEGRTTLS